MTESGLSIALEVLPYVPLTPVSAGYMVTHSEWRHPERVIESHELIFVRTGDLAIRVADSEYLVREGQGLILSPDVPHGGTQTHPPGLSFFWVHFLVAGGSSSQSPMGPAPQARADEDVFSAPGGAGAIRLPRLMTVQRPQVLEDLFRRFLDDQQSESRDPVAAGLLLALILAETARTGPTRPTSTVGRMVLADQVNRYIAVHFHENISTALIARELRCNPDYLGQVYRQVHDRTITEAIHLCRLHYACRRLTMTTDRIKEIAKAYGFGDSGYFHRIFRRYKGMTPGAYRRLYARMHVNTNM